MLKVLVVDDSPLFRRGVRDLVIEGFQGAKIGEAGNGYEMLELLRRKPWDVAVLDISMPGHERPGCAQTSETGVPRICRC